MSRTGAIATTNVVILGATSAIARAVADRLAAQGCRLVLGAREVDEAERLAADLRVRYRAEASAAAFDALDFDSHSAFMDAAVDQLGGRLDGVVLCHGAMAEQADAQADFALVRSMIDTNYTSAVSVLNLAAERLLAQAPGGEEGGGRGGFLCVISSVAGDRGRPSNYLYGSTKAALDAYLEGLRARLFKAGIAVTTVKPGFVDTAMTWGLPGMFLVAKPQMVARDMDRAIRRRSAVVYTPWFWRFIMAIIRAVPRPVFNRMKL
jgi:decaprenylphospho-beta-D-erythro-pentofuranosid-2-ulose 2-reductase